MRLTAGSFRELHWHTADEWSIMLDGNARVTVLNPDGTIFIDDVGKGDLRCCPRTSAWTKAALAKLPKDAMYIFPADLPKSLAQDKAAVGGKNVQSPIQYTFKMASMAPTFRTPYGDARVVDSRNFPAAKNI